MEERFIVSTDSTCDLYHDYVTEHRVAYVPLTFTLEENGTITEYVDAFTEYGQYVEFYNKLRNPKIKPKTAMLNYEAHVSHFTSLAEQGAEDVLHFTISSGLARTHEVAEQAAADVKKLYPKLNVMVVDPLTATVGQGLLVRYAVECRDKGMSIREAYDYVMGLRLHIQHFVVADDLGFLARGGRLSPAVAAIGSVIGIKPILSFDKEGKLVNIAKVRGVKKAISFIKNKLETEGPDEHGYVFIVHTDNEPVAEELAEFVRSKFGLEPHVQIMGPTIGSHVGPNAFALGYLSKSERNEF